MWPLWLSDFMRRLCKFFIKSETLCNIQISSPTNACSPRGWQVLHQRWILWNMWHVRLCQAWIRLSTLVLKTSPEVQNRVSVTPPKGLLSSSKFLKNCARAFLCCHCNTRWSHLLPHHSSDSNPGTDYIANHDYIIFSSWIWSFLWYKSII